MTRIFQSIPSRRADIRHRSQKIFATIRAELEKHMLAEERFFYPECEKIEGLKETLDHSRQEHEHIRNLLGEIFTLPIDAPTYNPKLNEMIKSVMHHAREEEEKVFPVVRKALSKSRLDRLASQMRHVKKNKQAKAA